MMDITPLPLLALLAAAAALAVLVLLRARASARSAAVLPAGAGVVAPGSRGRVLCIVNPFGGAGGAPRLFRAVVRPGLEARGYEVEQRETARPMHAWEMAREIAADAALRCKYAAVCVVGGDGLVHEVINGMQAAAGGDAGSNAPLPPLLVVPAGTGNGIFTSLRPDLRHVPRPLKAAKAVACETPLDADLMRITSHVAGAPGKIETSYGILSIAYGSLADGDHRGENDLRWMGPNLATVVAGIIAIVLNKTYRVRLTYRDVDRGADAPEVTEEVDVSLVTGINAPFLTSDLWALPYAKLDDGLVHLVTLPPTSRWRLARFFLSVESGEHVHEPLLRVVRTRGFVLEPLPSPGDGSIGHVMADGETVPAGRIEVVSVPRAVRLLS